MAQIKIEGVPPLDGEYPLDMDHLTNRDMHTIKQVAGVAGLDLQAAFEKGDLDIYVALSAIALRRAGKTFHVDQLWDAELGQITVDFTQDEVADVDPPVLTPPASSSDGGAKPSSSGPSSNGLSENPEPTRIHTGMPL